jgi:3-hydroxy-9,10-secoandrosta-1,3,5(10)-triene-9,17-dione monooxygenase
MDPPEPQLTPDEMITRAAALIPMLREQQDEAEERGYYSQAVHEEFLRAGFSRILQPRRFGGYEFDLRTFLRVMVRISTGDPGTGWCLTLGSSHAVIVATFFDAAVQAEAFGADGDFRCPHPVAPIGEARRADGGWRVSGKAAYASGIPYATWALCTALVNDGDDGPQPLALLIPRRDLTMLDDWGGAHGTMLGLSSSGSNSFVVEDVFVADAFAQPLTWFGEPPFTTDTPGFALHRNPLYLFRPAGPYHASLVAPAVGAARAAISEFRSLIAVKPTTFPPVVPRYQFHDDQRAFGIAVAMTDAAETILYGFADQYTAAAARAAAGEPTLNQEQDVRWWGMLQQAGGLAASAVETLAHRSTSSATARGTRLGRYFRDVTLYRQHISSQQIDFAVRNAAFYLGASGPWMGRIGERPLSPEESNVGRDARDPLRDPA